MAQAFLRRLFVFFFFVLALKFSSEIVLGSDKKSKAKKYAYKPGEVVVRLKKGFNTLPFAARLKTTQKIKIKPLKTDQSYAVVHASGVSRMKGINVDNAMERLLNEVRANPMVEYAEPNYLYQIVGKVTKNHGGRLNEEPTPEPTPEPSPMPAPTPVPTPPPYVPPHYEPTADELLPNDPDLWKAWGLLNYAQRDPARVVGTAGVDIDAPKAWKIGTGSKNVIVASIDTGVDYTHEDLVENMWMNPGEIPNNGQDDDGNGFVDDVYGWNFADDNKDPMDDNEHGTHTAGTIGAKGNNGIGIAGVAWDVSIMAIKFLDKDGYGSLEDAIESIKYATKMGAHIMNNSWGGGPFSRALHDAIVEAKEKGVLFVAAAGNERNDNDAIGAYPASYEIDNVVSVAATDNRDSLARFSNWGRNRVHIMAPGVNVYSTVPMKMAKYDSFSGTSMASPHVAGAAALLLSLNPEATYKDLKDRLIQSSDHIKKLRRKAITGGRLNIGNAVLGINPERPREPKETEWYPITFAYESEHPYANNSKKAFAITATGVSKLRVHFSKIETEAGYDVILIKDVNGEVLEEISGNHPKGYMTDYYDVESLVVEFVTDFSVSLYGFSIDRYEFID